MKGKIIIAAMAVMSSSVFAQTGYWMSAGNSNAITRYDAGVTSVFNTSGGQDYPIAVSGDVRTAASGQFSNDHGGQYDLNGNWLGVDYGDFATSPNLDMLFYDGATDGSRNFVVNYGNFGGVWATNRDWSGATKLFDLGGFANRLGITYDIQKQSLWVSGWDTGMVEEYDFNGVLLTKFDSGLGGLITCLAMDYTDNTLWMGRQGNGGVFNQYDRSGNLIGRFQDNTLANLNTLGGEFNVVPEPVSLVVLAGSLVAISRKRRKA